MKLELEALDSVAAGGTVSGRVNVLEGGESRALTVALSFNEKTRDYAAQPVRSEVPLHEGNLAAGESYEFSFTLPDDALPSVKSKHGELFWQLDAKSDERGFDTHASRRIEVVVRRAA